MDWTAVLGVISLGALIGLIIAKAGSRKGPLEPSPQRRPSEDSQDTQHSEFRSSRSAAV